MQRAIAEAPASSNGNVAVSLGVETKIIGAGTADAVAIKLGKGPAAVLIELTGAEFLQRWLHDNERMVAMVKRRLPGVVLDKAFRAHVRMLCAEESFAKDRRLHLSNSSRPSRRTTTARRWSMRVSRCSMGRVAAAMRDDVRPSTAGGAKEC